MQASPIIDATKFARTNSQTNKESKARNVYLSPRGKLADKDVIFDLASEEHLILLCGRYEGVDERALALGGFEEISIGDYILSGGEIAAAVIIDSVLRLQENVLGNEKSKTRESIYSGLLEYPQWTSPAKLNEGKLNESGVPDILLSGRHEDIALFRFEKSLRLTKKNRPDLFSKYVLKKLYSGENHFTKKELHILITILEN